MANKLMSWDDYKEQKRNMRYGDHVLTEVACPRCGTALYKDVSIALPSIPQQYRYFCEACGWFAYWR